MVRLVCLWGLCGALLMAKVMSGENTPFFMLSVDFLKLGL